MPKSLQIFRARKESISLCRGTVEKRPAAGLKNKLCFAPSLMKTQPCFRRYAKRSGRFIWLRRDAKRLTNYRSFESFGSHSIRFNDECGCFFQILFCFTKNSSLRVCTRNLLNPADVSPPALLIHRSELSLFLQHSTKLYHEIECGSSLKANGYPSSRAKLTMGQVS